MRDVVGYFGLALLLGTLSCTGVLEGETGGPGATPGPGPGPNGEPSNPGRGEMHRLNSAEYNNSVADVLGSTLQPANANWRGGEIEGFDNVAAVLGVDQTQFNLYLDAAEKLSNDVFASPTLKAKVLTCAQQDDMACVQSIVSKTGLRVFRRPLRAAEVTTYQKVYTATRALGQDHEGAIKHVLWSLLSSAEFLYRIELPGKANGKRPLDGFELASRLSYFLWSSAPDEALLESAANKGLSDAAAVKSTVGRMLADPKSNRFVTNFSGQWLGVRRLNGHATAPDRFPMWNTTVADAAAQEMYLYFNEFMRKDKPWTDFLKADLNFVNASLAPLYGMNNVTGTELVPTTNTTDKRKGFMGLAGFLTLTSMDRRTSPTLRGKWVLGNLLCQEPPPPPADVPKLEVGGKDLDNGNIRQILNEHRTRADCASCHALFDPFGVALENFDAIGRYRDAYGDGSPIDNTATKDGAPFAGLDGAADVVTADPKFKSCFADRLFIYGLGRSPSDEDKLWIKHIEEEWESGDLTINRLIEALTQSVPFRNSGDVK